MQGRADGSWTDWSLSARLARTTGLRPKQSNAGNIGNPTFKKAFNGSLPISYLHHPCSLHPMLGRRARGWMISLYWWPKSRLDTSRETARSTALISKRSCRYPQNSLPFPTGAAEIPLDALQIPIVHALRGDDHVKTSIPTITSLMYLRAHATPPSLRPTDFSDGGTNILDVTLLNSAPARRRRQIVAHQCSR
jgi:hypothetical protein